MKKSPKRRKGNVLQNNTLLQNEWIRYAMEAMEDSGWEGPPIIYLLCRPYHTLTHEIGEPEFIAKVTVDPDWSIPRWRMGVCVQFTQNVGKHLFYDVEEMSVSEAETLGVAFEALPVYDVDGTKISSFD